MTRAMRAYPEHATAGPRELRVATLRDGRLGDERRLRSRLRIGPTEMADVVVAGVAPGVLFEERGGDWWLVLADGVEGRVASGAPGARTVDALRAEVGRRLRLAPDARGRLELGETAILFQLVPPRPASPKPRLPQSVKGGALAIDWRFTTSLSAVATLLFGLLIGLESADWPIENRAELDPLIVGITWDEPPPPPEPVDQSTPEDGDTEADAEPRETERVDDAVARRSDRARASDGEVSLDAGDMARVAASAVIAGLGPDGSMADLLQDGLPTGDIEALLRGVEGVDPRASADRFRVRDTRGSGETDGIGHLVDGGDIGPAGEGEPLGETTVSGPAIDLGPVSPEEPSVFDDDLFVQRLRGVRRRVQRCYEREVTRDPTLEGRVDVEVEVHPAGNVSARIARDGVGSRRLGECITAAARSIRFPDGPEGGSVRYSFPFIFSAQR